MNYSEVCCYFANICVFLGYHIVVDLCLNFILVREYPVISILLNLLRLVFIQHMAYLSDHTSTHKKYVCSTIVACSFFKLKFGYSD